MILTDAELAGLAAICGDGSLPGLPRLASGTDQAEAAMAGLTDKGLISAQGRLTGPGKVVTRLVEEYCRARHHVFINQMKLSRCYDGMVVVLLHAGQGWRLARMDPWGVMLVLLKAFAFMRGGGPEVEPGPWGSMNVGKWVAQREGRDDGQVMVVREVDHVAGVSQVTAFDVFDGIGMVFDMTGRQAQAVSIGSMRARIAEVIGCDLERARRGDV